MSQETTQNKIVRVGGSLIALVSAGVMTYNIGNYQSNIEFNPQIKKYIAARDKLNSNIEIPLEFFQDKLLLSKIVEKYSTEATALQQEIKELKNVGVFAELNLINKLNRDIDEKRKNTGGNIALGALGFIAGMYTWYMGIQRRRKMNSRAEEAQ